MNATDALRLCIGRIELLSTIARADHDTDHPIATEYVLNKARAALAHAAKDESELVAALKWAVPLAQTAMEDCRSRRVMAGHSNIKGAYKNGEVWAGIYQHEVDQIERVLTILAKHATPEAPISHHE